MALGAIGEDDERKKESHGECEEVGEMKRKKKKKWRDGKS